MPELITIDELIKKLRSLSVSLGSGEPRVHLTYLSQIGLLPPAVKRKVAGNLTGCYPITVIPKIQEIERLKSGGLTYSQIKIMLTKDNDTIPALTPAFAPQDFAPDTRPVSSLYAVPSSVFSPGQNSLLLLFLGLLLGYLIAVNNVSQNQTLARLQTLSPVDNQTGNLVNITGNNKTDSGPIYVITVPGENFNRLGKTNINNLNTN